MKLLKAPFPDPTIRAPTPHIDVTMANPDARERLRQHFLNAEESDHPGKWNDLYRAGFIPWDKGLPSAPLAEALALRDLISEPVVAASGTGKQRKRALVPGCGKGYDVLLLAAFGYDAYGLETSELALKGARETEEKHGGDEVYRVRDESVGKGKVTWISGDFFKDDWAKSLGEGFDGTFDLLFDYTVCSKSKILTPKLISSNSFCPLSRLL